MSQYFEIHPTDPQPRLIRQAAEILREGGLVVYPTDSCYALGCHLDDKAAADRLRRVRGAAKDHNFTLICADLSQIAIYARVDNPQYRLLKAATPGPYTFILKATHEVPRRLWHPRRRTIGIRVPEHPVPHAMLAELGEPIMSSTLLLPGDELPMTDPVAIRARLEHEVDLVVDAGSCGLEPTTVVDLSQGPVPVVVRRGRGDLGVLGDYEAA